MGRRSISNLTAKEKKREVLLYTPHEDVNSGSSFINLIAIG